MNTKQAQTASIIVNKKARFEYFIEDEYEAGLVLQGWEVKSLRAGKVNISDAHVILKNGEAWLWVLKSNLYRLPQRIFILI